MTDFLHPVPAANPTRVQMPRPICVAFFFRARKVPVSGHVQWVVLPVLRMATVSRSPLLLVDTRLQKHIKRATGRLIPSPSPSLRPISSQQV